MHHGRSITYLEVIWSIFWIPVGRKCRHIVTVKLHVERDIARLQLYCYNGLYINLFHLHAPAARR